MLPFLFEPKVLFENQDDVERFCSPVSDWFSCQCKCVSSFGHLFKSNGRQHHLKSICYRCRQSDFTSLTKTSKSPLIVDSCANLPTVFCKSDNLSQKSIYFLAQRRIFVFLISEFCIILFRWFTGALYLSLAIILALAIFEEPEVICELVISPIFQNISLKIIGD